MIVLRSDQNVQEGDATGDDSSKEVGNKKRKINGRIAPMVEQRFEEPIVQVRLLLRPRLFQ